MMTQTEVEEKYPIFFVPVFKSAIYLYEKFTSHDTCVVYYKPEYVSSTRPNKYTFIGNYTVGEERRSFSVREVPEVELPFLI